MKRSRFSGEQIIGILKEHEAGGSVADFCRKHAGNELKNRIKAGGNVAVSAPCAAGLRSGRAGWAGRRCDGDKSERHVGLSVLPTADSPLASGHCGPLHNEESTLKLQRIFHCILTRETVSWLQRRIRGGLCRTVIPPGSGNSRYFHTLTIQALRCCSRKSVLVPDVITGRMRVIADIDILPAGGPARTSFSHIEGFCRYRRCFPATAPAFSPDRRDQS